MNKLYSLALRIVPMGHLVAEVRRRGGLVIGEKERWHPVERPIPEPRPRA